MKIFFGIIFFLSVIGCDYETKHKMCIMTYNDFSDAVRTMTTLEEQPIEKLYYSNIAAMNLQILMHKNCCKWSDTCPAGIYDR